jgi:flagellar hook assembly protein FlgD
VRTVYVGMREAGAYDVRWDGRGKDGRLAPSGVYTIRAVAGAQSVGATVVRTP